MVINVSSSDLWESHELLSCSGAGPDLTVTLVRHSAAVVQVVRSSRERFSFIIGGGRGSSNARWWYLR